MGFAYAKKTWHNAPQTDTPVSAENLQVMDDQLQVLSDNMPDKRAGQTDTILATWTYQVTLGGAEKTLLKFAASDGKTFSFRLTASNDLRLYDDTDGRLVCEFKNAGGPILPAGRRIFIQASDPGSAAATGDAWLKDA